MRGNIAVQGIILLTPARAKTPDHLSGATQVGLLNERVLQMAILTWDAFSPCDRSEKFAKSAWGVF